MMLRIQVKRIGFELRLMGSYKSLPEFEIYTDLNVRCFDLQTKVQILASKAEDANTENAELSVDPQLCSQKKPA